MIQSDPAGNGRSSTEMSGHSDANRGSNNNVETPVVLAVNDEH